MFVFVLVSVLHEMCHGDDAVGKSKLSSTYSHVYTKYVTGITQDKTLVSTTRRC